jgi:hypothetical protein
MPARSLFAALALFLIAGPASAGTITVFTQIWETRPGSGGEIPVAGLANWAILTWGGGLDPAVTLLGTQTSARQPVVGFWPVMEFQDQAQYLAQLGVVASVPTTPVQLYAEVWNGVYGGIGVEVERLFLDATVTARVSATPGMNAVEWSFDALPVQVQFGDGTLVSLDYEAVRQPDGTPQIQFRDGSPPLGFPGPVYYPSVVEAEVVVTRPPTEPGPSDPPGTAATPEPASGLLLAGFALGGLAARRRLRGVASGSLHLN